MVRHLNDLELPTQRGGGQVVKVQSTTIETERCGLDPSSVCQFQVRIGEEAERLSKSRTEAASFEFETATSCDFSVV
jgi:hypothetical protein